MAKFLMLGKYSIESMQEMSAQRTDKASKLIESAGGKVESIHALIGQFDLALLVDLPSMDAAVKTSIQLTKMSRIAFTTLPAIPVAEFDKLVG